jgi:hypothetical protein
MSLHRFLVSILIPFWLVVSTRGTYPVRSAHPTLLLLLLLLLLLFAALYLRHLFPQVDYSYDLALEQLKLHTLHKRRYHLDALFLTQVYRGSKFCPSVLETVGLRILVRYIRDFSMFSVCSSSKNCPSARCASAANVVCRDVDIFGTKTLSLKHIL